MIFLFALVSDKPEVFLPKYSQTAILHAAHYRRVVNGKICMLASSTHVPEPGTSLITMPIKRSCTVNICICAHYISPCLQKLIWRIGGPIGGNPSFIRYIQVMNCLVVIRYEMKSFTFRQSYPETLSVRCFIRHRHENN